MYHYYQFFIFPIDTAKVRLQIHTQDGTQYGSKGLIGMLKSIAIEEKIANLYSGILPALQRQLVYAPLRFGIYQYVTDNITKKSTNKNISSYLSTKIIGGVLSGIGAISIANPTDVVKIRLQAQGKPGVPKRYSGPFDCYKKIFINEGIKGFYSGFLPNLMSSSVLNTAELVTYFHSKQILKQYMPENSFLHLLCGFLSGLVCVGVGTPFVMMKTRMMNKQVAYKSIVDCISKTLKHEGPYAFYKGWSAFLVGITTWNMVMFMTYEQVRKVVNCIYKQ